MPRQLVNYNLVYNGDFEIAPPTNVAQTINQNWINGTSTGSSNKQIYGWCLILVGGATGQFDNSTSNSGNWSIKLNLNSTGQRAYAAPYRSTSTTADNVYLPALPNTSYTMTAYMKTSYISGSDTGAYIGVYEFNGSLSTGVTHLTTAVNTTTGWTQYTITFTTASTCRYLAVLPTIIGNAGTATLVMDAWFDNIQLYPTITNTRTQTNTRLIQQNTNSSLFFNGSTNVGITANSALNVVGNASNTIYSWGTKVKIPGNINVNGNIIGKITGTSNSFCTRILAGGFISFRLYDGTNNPNIITTKPYNDNQWHSMICSRNGANFTAYIDGVQVGTSTVGSLGDCSNTANVQFNTNNYGNMSDSWLTLNALTAQDAINYHQTSILNYPCLYRLPLNEGAGSTAYDISGNVNNGTITAGTYSNDVPFKTRKLVNDNLVYNGDFEYAPPTNVAQTTWYRWVDGTAGGALAATPNIFNVYAFDKAGTGNAVMFDSANPHSGKYSVKVSTTAVASRSYVSIGWQPLTSTPPMVALPNTSYTYSYWMKTQVNSGAAATGAFMAFEWIQGNGSYGGEADGTHVTTTTGWTQYTGTFTTGATARYFAPLMIVNGNDGAATLIMDAWFDDIVLVPTTTPTRTLIV